MSDDSVVSYQDQLASKIDNFKDDIAQRELPFDSSNIEVYTSPQKHFRMRAEFKICTTEILPIMLCLIRGNHDNLFFYAPLLMPAKVLTN